MNVQKPLSYGLIVLLFAGLFLLWANEDIATNAMAAVAIKHTIVLALAVGTCAIWSERSLRRFLLRVRALQQLAANLPGTLAEYPARFSPAPDATQPLSNASELDELSRSLRLVSEGVRVIVNRAKLEVSRREAILSCMAEGVLTVDGDLNVIFCNQAFAEAFNTRTPIIEGQMLYEVVREPVLRDVLGRVLQSGMPEATRMQLPSAGSRWFEARALPLASSGATPGAVIVLHDITDIQRQEQLRKDFVADVSHELRTPLAAIRGYAETLLDGALEDHANNRKFVEIILSHAIRLNNIAADLLILSEMDANAENALSPEPISVSQVIDSAMNSVQNTAALRGVSLYRDDCSACVVLGHRFRLEQVISNLLDNAIKFNRADGEVRIDCRVSGEEWIQISVSDTGVGIPQADLKRVFERFYRVDKARARATGGTGLGLPIVKGVVEGMGGSVSVESQLNKGSKFTILLKSASAGA